MDKNSLQTAAVLIPSKNGKINIGFLNKKRR